MSKDFFQHVLDNDEQIIRSGKPHLLPFIFKGVGFLIIGIIRGIFDLTFFNNWKSTNFQFNLFILIHSAPFRLSILNMIRLFFVFPNTIYSYTNKRILIRGGFLGIDYKSIDFDKIQNIEVNVNPIENYLKVGTIKVFSGELNNKGYNITNDMIGIRDPYGIFKELKKISVDVKTDYNYPNDLRPKTNKGYKTEYTGEIGNHDNIK